MIEYKPRELSKQKQNKNKTKSWLPMCYLHWNPVRSFWCATQGQAKGRGAFGAFACYTGTEEVKPAGLESALPPKRAYSGQALHLSQVWGI